MEKTENAVIVPFTKIDEVEMSQVGMKSSKLGKLVSMRLPVPNGFVLTTGAFNYHFIKSKLSEIVNSELNNVDPNDSVKLENISQKIRSRILKVDIVKELKEVIIRSYSSLSGFSDSYVAIRSSLPHESVKRDPFAGQYSTFLNVKGKDDLVDKVKQCWASLYSPQNLFYAITTGIDASALNIAVIVQKMVQAEVSGILFTANPIDNDESKISIECILGLGEPLVHGELTPDTYLVEKKSGKILETKIIPQDWMKVRKGKAKKGEDPNVKVNVGDTWKVRQKLESKYIEKLVKVGKKVEKALNKAQEIEWVYEGGRIWIVQSRDISSPKIEEDSWKKTPTFAALKSKVEASQSEEIIEVVKKPEEKKIELEDDKETTPDQKVLLRGRSTSNGFVSGPVKIVKEISDLADLSKGTIVVSAMITPEFEGKMDGVIGILVDSKARDSYETIMARSLGVPCVVDSQVATKVIHDDEYISLNGDTGEVIAGVTNEGLLKTERILQSRKKAELTVREAKKEEKPATSQVLPSKLKTATKIFVDVDNPDEAPKLSSFDVAGVGDLDSEYIIKAAGFHPKVAGSRKKDKKKFIDNLVLGLFRVARSFDPRPVIYKISDMSAVDYLSLAGAAEFELNEANPLLGFRGASRFLANADELELELEAVRIIRNKENIKNLWLSIPYVRTYSELREIKQFISSFGFRRSSTFKLFLVAQIPSVALRIEKMLDLGIDGVVVDVDILSQMVLGYDKSNPKLTSMYKDGHPAVLELIDRIVKACNKAKVHSQVKGAAVSASHSFIKKIIKMGATSILAKSSMVEQVREYVYDAEKSLILKRKK